MGMFYVKLGYIHIPTFLLDEPFDFVSSESKLSIFQNFEWFSSSPQTQIGGLETRISGFWADFGRVLANRRSQKQNHAVRPTKKVIKDVY